MFGGSLTLPVLHCDPGRYLFGFWNYRKDQWPIIRANKKMKMHVFFKYEVNKSGVNSIQDQDRVKTMNVLLCESYQQLDEARLKQLQSDDPIAWQET